MPSSDKPLASGESTEMLRIDLRGCDPVPTGAKTTLRFSLNRRTLVRTQVYDLSGRLIMDIGEGLAGPGEHTESLDFSSAPMGAYLIRIDAEGLAATKEVVVLR